MEHGTSGDRPAVTPADLADEAVALARAWAGQAGAHPDRGRSALLARLLADEAGLPFTLAFIDGVVLPEDRRTAARALSGLARDAPRFLPWPLRWPLRLAGILAPLLPGVVVPAARRALRVLLGHLVADARPGPLRRSIRRLTRQGLRANVNLLGEAVLGEGEAERRRDGTGGLLQRPGVDYVSVKVSAVASNLNLWDRDGTVARVIERLRPLYAQAVASPAPAFITLDMEEYRDLDLTVAVFTGLLDEPALHGLSAGIVLQAYLPDALAALDELTTWAQRRVAAGGAPIRVRIVKGANLAMERVDAELHGWPLVVWPDKAATDAHYKRLIDRALQPDRVAAVRIGVAGHNLFDQALAHLLAARRGLGRAVETEMLRGMSPALTRVLRRHLGTVRLYTPAVAPRDFSSALSYLARRLEENASHDNFLSAAADAHAFATRPDCFAREEQRFRASVALLGAVDDADIPSSLRRQDRTREERERGASAFANCPDTDTALPANRPWIEAVYRAIPGSALGEETLAAAHVDDPAALEAVLLSAQAAASGWAATSASERAALLRAAADLLAAHRAELLEVMASEAAKTLAEGDPEVSEAIDFARYYAGQAEELERDPEARFEPVAITLVTPPWNFPVAIAAGGVLAALAAGSTVVLKPAPQARRCAAVLAALLWEAGVPRDALHLVDAGEGELGRSLVADPRIGRVVLTGAFETAVLFRSWRPTLPLLAETSGKNALVITPSADPDLAVADLVRSAFGHAGQKCSAASLGILVGSVAHSERVLRQLVDAASSLVVALPAAPAAQLGPLIEPAAGKLLDALTLLHPGERWLLEPRALDAERRLWSPGIKSGVQPGSAFHRTEYFGPVLGLMAATDLDEAIRWQNGTDFGLTAGLHSLDAAEIEHWLERVEAGNLSVNRGITGAIVQRQPFGGWKRSTVGGGAKAGGPDYVAGFGRWAEREPGPLDAAWLEKAEAADARAWRHRYGRALDPSGLRSERNLLRHRPLPVLVRAEAGTSPWALQRVLSAAARAGAPVRLSRAPEVAAADFLQDVREHGIPEERVRLLARDEAAARDAAAALAAALDGDPAVAILAEPPTASGRSELRVFLREQALSITAHRFGSVAAAPRSWWSASGRPLPS